MHLRFVISVRNLSRLNSNLNFYGNINLEMQYGWMCTEDEFALDPLPLKKTHN
jgi:hypothetical protein